MCECACVRVCERASELVSVSVYVCAHVHVSVCV